MFQVYIDSWYLTLIKMFSVYTNVSEYQTCIFFKVNIFTCVIFVYVKSPFQLSLS